MKWKRFNNVAAVATLLNLFHCDASPSLINSRLTKLQKNADMKTETTGENQTKLKKIVGSRRFFHLGLPKRHYSFERLYSLLRNSKIDITLIYFTPK